MNLVDRILDAHRGLRPQVPVSSLDHSAVLSASLGCRVWLKNEHLQPTGSFKVRGSANKIRTLPQSEMRNGVITASTGNHGQGVARAGRLAGVPVTIYLPEQAPPEKIAAMRALGAELVVAGSNSLDAEEEARRQAGLQGKPYVAPYNDIDVVAGQGTAGAELAEQAKANGITLDAVFICLGGGGLFAGVGQALRALSPATKAIAVSAEASKCMLDSLEAGKIVRTPEYPTLSEASTGAVEPGSITFDLCREVIDRAVAVEEIEIAQAMRDIAVAERWMVEGTTGVALAGLRKVAADYRDANVAIIVCGRNIGLDLWIKAMRMAEAV